MSDLIRLFLTLAPFVLLWLLFCALFVLLLSFLARRKERRRPTPGTVRSVRERRR